MLKEGKKEKIIGAAILAVIIILVVVIKTVTNITHKEVETVFAAVGGGKEDFLADEDFNKVLEDLKNDDEGTEEDA